MTDEPTPTASADTAPAEPHRPTLMTVHAHPDDETIGTGGVMAKAVAAGRRVVLVTGTRGEQGEIVVPSIDTPDNHRRLGELRAAELEAAMGELGVTEWESLGYRDSDMMGRPGNNDPRTFWQADVDEAAGRLTWLVRRYQPDVMTTYNSFGGYGHPDHIRVHEVGLRAAEVAGTPHVYESTFNRDYMVRQMTAASRRSAWKQAAMTCCAPPRPCWL
jgi:LmbE family N-acetylglucosaminyl deacetylase